MCRETISFSVTAVLGLAVSNWCAAADPSKGVTVPPGVYVLAGGFTQAKGQDQAEVKKPFTLQPGQYILSGGPKPTDSILVDDDLELSVGDRKLFIDDDHVRCTETDDGCTYRGWPIVLPLPPKGRLRVRAIDCAATEAELGDLYLHRHDGVGVQLVKARKERSAKKLPHVFFDEEFEVDHVFASPAPPHTTALTAERLRALWEDLGRRDPATAYFALWEMTSDSAHSVPFLAKKVRPVAPTDPRRLNQLLANLDADLFQVRQQATLELKQMEKLAKLEIRQALEQRPSPEARLRLERLLRRIQDAIYTPDTMRGLRAVEILEHIDSRESRHLLEELAAGVAEARLSREAKAALVRLQSTVP